MKICIITQKVIRGDGQGRVNYEVTWEALRRNHEVNLVTGDLAQDLQQHPSITWIQVSIRKIPSAILRNLWFGWQSAIWLNKNRQQFDIIFVNGGVTWGKSHFNAVHFVHSTWLQSPYHTSKIRKDFYGLYQYCVTSLNSIWERKSFEQSEHLIAVSNQVKRDLISLGTPENKITVIRNGVDLEEFYPGPAQRDNLGLPSNKTVALFVGEIQSSRKNLDTTLKALVEVPDLHLAVVGRETGSPYLKMVKNLGLQKRVTFLGYRTDVAEIMRTVDFFVFPSRYETFGLVVLEAMASGLPVITTKATAASELVDSKSGEILSDPNDVTDLIRALTKFKEKTTIAPKTIENFTYTWAQCYSCKAMAQKYLDIFNSR